MSDLRTLTAARAAAHAAHVARPTKASESALADACRALTAARRADGSLAPAPSAPADPAVHADVQVRADRAVEAQRMRDAAPKLRPIGIWCDLTQAWDCGPTADYAAVAHEWEHGEHDGSSSPSALAAHGGPARMSCAERAKFSDAQEAVC